MSFYGQSFLRSFGTFLGKFVIRNKGKNIEEPTTPDDNDIVAVPSENFNIDSSNRWITLNATKDSVAIGHAAPGTTIDTIPGINYPTGSSNSATELAFGSYLSVPTIQFDKLGHKVSQSTVFYKIPAVDFTAINSDISELTDRVVIIEEFLDTVKDAEELYF